jgi:hypothetical protein
LRGWAVSVRRDFIAGGVGPAGLIESVRAKRHRQVAGEE